MNRRSGASKVAPVKRRFFLVRLFVETEIAPWLNG
jgi:hypothetical protein